jgi:hypothetical protein
MGNHHYYLANATTEPLQYQSPDDINTIQKGVIEPGRHCELPPCKTVEVLIGSQWALIKLNKTAEVGLKYGSDTYVLNIMVDPTKAVTTVRVDLVAGVR